MELASHTTVLVLCAPTDSRRVRDRMANAPAGEQACRRTRATEALNPDGRNQHVEA